MPTDGVVVRAEQRRQWRITPSQLAGVAHRLTAVHNNLGLWSTRREPTCRNAHNVNDIGRGCIGEANTERASTRRRGATYSADEKKYPNVTSFTPVLRRRSLIYADCNMPIDKRQISRLVTLKAKFHYAIPLANRLATWSHTC